MFTQSSLEEYKADLLREGFEIDDDGHFDGCGSKWNGEHWSSKFLWDCSLDQSLQHDMWSHEGLGFWAMFNLDSEQMKALELTDVDSHWVEIHERDDGIMQVSYWNDSLHESRVKELDELCHDPMDEDEEDERKWDSDTYEIIVSPTAHNDAKLFVKWLRVRGHEAKLGDDSRDYVDGEWTQNDDEARDVFETLWARFEDGDA